MTEDKKSIINYDYVNITINISKCKVIFLIKQIRNLFEDKKENSKYIQKYCKNISKNKNQE